MFLPLGDTPNPRNFTPWVNWMLIAANVAVYLMYSMPMSGQPVDFSDPLVLEYLRAIFPGTPAGLLPREVLSNLSAYDLFVFQHGYKSAAPQFVDLIYSMFLHGGFLHLAGNMLFLWIFGDNVEHRFGRLAYLMLYLGTGIAATVAFAFLSEPSMVPLVGASGAISGVLGLYYLLFPRNQVRVFVVLFPFFFNTVLLPCRWVLGFYVLVDNLLPFLIGAESSVAYGAHLGGFAAGLLVAWVVERSGFRLGTGAVSQGGEAQAGFRGTVPGSSRFGASGSGAVDGLRDAVSRKDAPAAFALLRSLSRADMVRLKPEECVELADALDRSGQKGAAMNLLRTCLSVHAESGNLARVYLALGQQRLAQGQVAAAYQHLQSVFDYNPSREVAEQAREALALIDKMHGRGR
ncbi:MAG: rhomboid family intramembrane serine protease [Deltaproteobacteria bacterium]|nr:rhomboid family intramembrane serine protease [Deltaproteobacteria bacterium]